MISGRNIWRAGNPRGAEMPDIFQIKDKDLLGRVGVLETRSGRIETPVFLPVIDPIEQLAPGSPLTPRDIEAMGFRAIITNAYMIKKRYGGMAIEKGVKNLLGFSGIVMTDSGAYQHMVYGSIDVSNREIVEYQDRIGSDIAVILDIPTKEGVEYREALYSVEETLRRALDALEIISGSQALWVLPIQGGGFLDLVRRSAREAKGIDGYSIYGIGSPVTYLQAYRYIRIVDMIITAKEEIYPSYPVHLFGAGHPMILPFLVALGVDMFDSASYILYAKDNRYITEYGTESIWDLEVFPCSCPICSKHDPRDVAEMLPRDRVRALAMHNLYTIAREIKRVKTYIREGRLWDLLLERSQAHPSLVDALRKILGYSDKIEPFTPYSKGRRGLFIFDGRSLRRPQVMRTRERLERYIKYYVGERMTRGSTAILIPAGSQKPFSGSPDYIEALRNVGEMGDEIHFLFYTPYFGIVPEDLEDTYPFSQHEAPEHMDLDVLRDLAEILYRYISIIFERGSRVIIYFRRDSWSQEAVEILRRKYMPKTPAGDIVFREL
jgi:7-cyano-7-deazaguanine tRNA-ribosyltransferase